MQSIDTIAEVINKKATIVTAMPVNANDGALVMFLGTDVNYVTGGLYQYSVTQSTWVQLFAVTAADIGLGNVDNTADAVKHVALADEATTALSANITRTADTTNGDQLQIGSGTAINIVNAYHAATADTATDAGTATTATSATSATTATNANKVYLNQMTGTLYIPLVDSTRPGYRDLCNPALGITFNTLTNTITATGFVGNLTGNADTATTATSANVTDKIRVSTPAIGTLSNGDIWIA